MRRGFFPYSGLKDQGILKMSFEMEHIRDSNLR